MRHRVLFLTNTAAPAVLGALLLLSGCAATGPVLLEVNYQAPADLPAGAAKTVVAVSPLRDLRDAKPAVLGRRTISKYRENELVVQGTVAELVTTALQEALRVRGVTVTDAPAWEPDGATVPAVDGAVLIGGEIKVLEVETLSRPLNVRTKAVVQLRVSAADASTKAVFRTLNLSSSLEREDVVFTFGVVEESLSEALTAAIDQLMKDDEFRKKVF